MASASIRGGRAAAGKGKEKEKEKEKDGEAAAKVTRGENSCSVDISVPVGSPKLMMLEVSGGGATPARRGSLATEVLQKGPACRCDILEGYTSCGRSTRLVGFQLQPKLQRSSCPLASCSRAPNLLHKRDLCSFSSA